MKASVIAEEVAQMTDLKRKMVMIVNATKNRQKKKSAAGMILMVIPSGDLRSPETDPVKEIRGEKIPGSDLNARITEVGMTQRQALTTVTGS